MIVLGMWPVLAWIPVIVLSVVSGAMDTSDCLRYVATVVMDTSDCLACGHCCHGYQ